MTDDVKQNGGEAMVDTNDVNVVGETGRETLVGQAAGAVDVSAPAAGETVNVTLVKGQTANLTFDATAATPIVEGNDFVLTFDTNGDGEADSRIVFQNLVEESQGADAPVLVIGGIELSAGLLIGQAQALAEGETLETAAGAGAGPTGGGGSTYSDDLGSAIDLLNAQGVIDPTELQFGLLSSLDEITDPAQGTLLISFLTTITEVEEGPDGGITGSFGGGFEDWLPNHHLRDGDAGEDSSPFLGDGSREAFSAPMRMVLTFVPSDNETLDTVVINELPEGVRLFIGGSEEGDEYTGGFPVTVSPSDFEDIYVLPPQHSDADITITGSATISDPDSGESATLGYTTVAVIDAVADLPDDLRIGDDGGENGQQTATLSDVVRTVSPSGGVVNSGDEEDVVTIPVTVEFADFADDSEAHELVVDGVPEGWDIRPIPGAEIWQMDGDNVYQVTFGTDGKPVLTLVTDTSDLPASLQHQIALAAGVAPSPDALSTLENTIGDEVADDGYVRYFIDVSENVDDANGGNTADTSDDGSGSLTTNISFNPNDWTNDRLPDGTPRGGEGAEGDEGPATITVHAVATETVPEGSGSELTDADGTPVDENNQSVAGPVSVDISINEDIPEFTSPITLIHDETARTKTGEEVSGVDPDSNDIPGVPASVQAVLDTRYKALKGDDGAELGDTVGQAQNTFTYDLKTDGSNDETDGSDGPTDTDAPLNTNPSTPDDLEAITFDLSGDIDSLLTSGGSVITLHQDADQPQVVWGIDESGNVIFAVHIDGTLNNDGNTGNLTFVQYGPIDHNQPGDGGEGSHDENASFDLPIKLTDDEGDSVTATATINIEDDGPVITKFETNDGADIRLDESVGADAGDSNADDETSAPTAGAIGFATIDASSLITYEYDAGTDGEKSSVFSLTLDNSASGLFDTASGEAVVLIQNGNVITGTAGNGGATVFTITVDPATGGVTVEQFRALKHSDTDDHDEATDPLEIAAGAIKLTVTLTDGDDDTDSESVELGSLIKFEDDGPTADLSAKQGAEIRLDETDNDSDDNDVGGLLANVTVAGSALFTNSSAFGSDGAATSNATVYSLTLNGTQPVDSGLVDAVTNEPITLSESGGVITGSSATGGTVFTVSIDPATGAVTVQQSRAIEHDDVNDHDESTSPAIMTSGLIDATVTVTDGDGDSHSDDAELGGLIKFEDDGPTADLSAKQGAEIRLDETDNDSDDNDVGGLLANVTVAGSALFTNSSAFGSDGAATSNATVYSLTLNGTQPVDSGLVDAVTNEPITLSESGGVITGSSATGGTVFTVSIDPATGAVTVQQSRAIEHDDVNDHDESTSPAIMTSGLIDATVTVTDGDGDSHSDDAELGGLIKFEDDGPTADLSAKQGAEIRLDETDNDSDDNDVGGLLANVTVAGSTLFTNSSAFGSDGAATSNATVYSLTLNGTQPVDSGLVDAVTNEPITLSESGGVITGSSATGGTVFTVSIDPATGAVTVQQSRAIEHDDVNDHDESTSPAIMTSGLIDATVTVTDGDGDSHSDDAELGGLIKFEDDGPSVTSTGPQEFVLNGSFEEGHTLSGATYGTFNSLSDGSWTNGGAGQNGFEIQHGNVAGPAQHGDALLELDANDNSVAQQDIAGMTAGEDYVLTFYYQPRVNNGTDTDDVIVKWNGVVVEDLTSTDAPGGWKQFTVTVKAAAGTNNLAFEGDGNSESLGGYIDNISINQALIVDETDLNVDDTLDFSGRFTADFGSDGQGAPTTYVTSTVDGTDSGLVDTASGQAILLYNDGAGGVVGRVGGISGDDAFTVTVDAGGVVKLDQILAVRHPDPDNHDDVVGIPAGKIDLTATVTDGDGDTADSTIDLGTSLYFKDDGPAISVSDETSVVEGETLNGTWSSDYGADGAGVTKVVVEGNEYDLDTPITLTNLGVLTVKSDGSWTFQATKTQADATPDPVVSFGIKIIDEDMDTASATEEFTITLVEDIDITAGPIVTTETDAALPVDLSAAVSVGINAVDGNESLTALNLTFTGLPAGTVASGDAVLVGNVLTVTLNSDGSLPADFGIVLPKDFSTENPDTNISYTVNATSNEGTDSSGPHDLTVNFEGDVEVDAKDVNLPENSTSVALNIDAAATDVDSSESITTTKIVFDSLPLGTTVNGGTLAGLTWTGTEAQLEALVLQNLPVGFEGSITGTVTVNTDEGGVASDTFTATIAADSTPTVTSTSGIVEEAALVDGSNPSSTAESTTGSLSISTGGDTVDTVEIQDGTGTWVDVTGGGTVSGDYGDLVVSVDGSGNYTWTYTLDDNTTDHTNTSTDGTPGDRGADDTVPDNFSVRVTDSDGDVSPPSNFNVTVEDDGPTAVDDADCVEVVVGDQPPQNIAFVVDESGSVSQSNYETQIDGVRTFMNSLVSQGDPAELAISLVTFGSDAEDYGTFVYQDDGNGVLDLDDFVRLNDNGTPSSTTLDDTLIAVRADYDNGGSTNYDAAMQSLFASDSEYLTNPVSGLPDAENRMYFISDGGPNSSSTGISSEIDTDIATAITDNNIQVTGIGVGSSSSVENGLEDYFLAVDGSDVNNPSIPASQYSYVSVPDFADLADALDGTTDNAPVATGNVVTGTDVAGGDVNTTDGVADTMGADGFGSIAWDGATAGGTTVVGTYGTLTVDADGNYSYALDYSNSAVTDLPLGDTLPEVFTYTVTDGDGDTDQATLTLTIKGADHGVKITDLTPALTGGDAIVDEDDLLDGSDDTPESTTVTGDFAISAIDGLGCIIIQGQPATPYEFTEAHLLNSGTVNLEVITELGNILTITGYDPATGVVSYSYELLDDETHAPGSDALFDDIALTVKDTDGDSASDTLSIQIVDDVPTATDDNGSITEGATLTVTTANGVLSNDEFGADGAASPAITGVRTGDDTGAEPTGSVGTQIVGSYGTLTLNADGSYSYVANGNLNNASPLTDTFSYTITDGDGDTDVAELVITINDGGIPTVTDPSGGPLALSVSEVNLPSDVDDGTITFQAGSDDIVAVEFDGTNDPSIAGIDEGFTWSLSGDGLTWTGSDSEGAAIVLTVSGGTATAGNTGTATVTVTLSDELKHDLGGGSIDISGVNVVATDTDGDKASAPVSVAVIDDVPTAVDDVDCIEVSIDAVPPQNIGIVMDFSGSVNSTERAAQVDSVKAFAATLFNGNPNVTISIVAFDDNAGTVGVFTDLTSFNVAMDAAADGTFTQPGGDSFSGGGSTDFEAGLEELFSNSGGAGYAEQPGANNQVFFLSDGNRNDGASSIGSNNVVLDNNGKALLNSGAIELTAVAIGDSVSPQTFEDFFGVGIVDAPSEVVTTAFADLADALNGNVGSSGNVATGNVVTGVDVANGDANTTDGNADDLGADGFGSITWDNVSGGTTVVGTYGTLTVDANGNYSYALDYTDPDVIALAGGATLTETFTYTVKDSDGDGDTATLTLTLKNTDQDVEITHLTPEAQGGDAIVDEDNLADGSSPDSGAVVQNGDFNISTPDGVGDLTIGGETVISAGVFTPVTITTPEGNALEITSYNPADGKVSYTYTLVDNSTGHGPADNGENNLFDNLNVTVTDVDGDTASSTLSIKIIDDVPTAENDAVETTTDSSVLPQNIAFVVDESGSVGQSNYQSQIDGVRTFITDLVTNGAPEKLAFSLVTFGSDAEDYGSFVFKDNGVGGIDLDDFVRINNDGSLSSTTLDDTLTTVRGNYDNGGSTNYDAGMQSLFASNSEYLTNPITDLPLSQNHLYFISDGEPNSGSNNHDEIDQSVATSIINNAVQVTGIGIGNSSGVEDGLEDYFLNQGGGDSGNPSIPADQYDFVSVPNFANLAAQLLAASGTTQQIASGSLIANDDLGADGASVTAISIDGVPATFNGSTNSWELDGATFEFGYNTATDEFILIFDEGEAADLAVTYTITDGDGDTSSAVLNITAAEPLSAVDDSIITNITSGDIDIPDWVLTQNDGGSSARDISGVSNTTGGSTSHDGSADETTFTLPDNSFGSGYTVVDEAANDDYDTPLNDTIATAVDLTDRSQWGPVTDGNAGNVKNAALPSILFKGDIDNESSGNDRDYDMVAVSLLAGEKLILDIDNGSGGNESVDTLVRLYDSSGTKIDENDDALFTNGGAGSTLDYSSVSLDSYLEYTASSDGTYYVRVESYDRDEEGDYDLWLSVDNSGVSTPTPGFDYTVEDGADSDDASVVISTVDSLTLTGTDDGEILIGGSLADIINAGGGDDILIGGTGANVLTGGTGSDTFVLSDINSQDVITDFNGTGDDGDGDILNLHDLLIEAGLDQAALDGLNDGNINDHVHLDSTAAGVTTVSVSSDGNSFTTVATLSGVGDNEIIKVQVDDDHILNMTTL